MKVEGAPLIVFFCLGIFLQFAFLNKTSGFAVQGVFLVNTLVGIVLENHHFDASLCACFWMKLYPFVQFKDRTDTFGGAGLVVEIFATATVAEQAQACHDGLLSLFEVDIIEFAKYH